MEDLQKDCKYYVHIGFIGSGGYCEKHFEKGRIACEDCNDCKDYEEGKDQGHE